LSGQHAAKKFGFAYCTTDYHKLLHDSDIDLILVLTRHGSHAHFVEEVLRAGKHVYVEKPLAIDQAQLESVVNAYTEALQVGGNGAEAKPILFVGFNRRFSPFTQWLKERFRGVKQPLAVHCTINAGAVPADHWVHDPKQGGGRIIGEVCHFVDLIEFLTDSVPSRVHAETLNSKAYKPSDNVGITLKMANGAIGSITYVAGGDKTYPRERVEVFGGGAVGVIDNFRAASFIQQGRRKSKRNWLGLDRGHRGELEALISAIRVGGTPPVAFEEYVSTTLATFAIEESIRKGTSVDVEVDQSLASVPDAEEEHPSSIEGSELKDES